MYETHQQAAKILLNNRNKNAEIARLNAPLTPLNSEQALLIQAEMIKQCSDAVMAWKCLLPLSEQQFIVAPIFAETIQRGEYCHLFSDNGKARIEPEIAFILGKDLIAQDKAYSDAEIDAAIQSCHMALELMQDRFREQSDISFYEKLADCLVNQGLYIGPEIDKKLAYQASEFQININQPVLAQKFSGKHPNQYPQRPIYWLINFMTQRGVSFKAGQAIITGSYAGVVDVDFHQSTSIEYENIGQYQVTFLPK